VADLPQAYPYTPIFQDNPPRLLLQVAKSPGLLPRNEPEAPPAPREIQSSTTASSTKPARGPRESMARQLGLKIRTVVIDPGHGGKDNGASGNSLKEKDITLKTAKLLKKKIERDLGLSVIMTRDSDKFVTLDRRPKISKDNKGDLFISIHANANDLSKVEGFETYLLNFATDQTAMSVASRENAVADKSMSEMNDIIQLIAKNAKVAESRVLAKALHSEALASLRKKFKVRDLGVKEAVFIVLVNVEVPAVLLEIGFLTNADDAKKLSQDDYLESLTDGLVLGLKSYIKGLSK
jgi:N-acetylmuramoyl-L-alanine amidase